MAHRHLGLCHRLQGRLGDAAASLQRAVDATPAEEAEGVAEIRFELANVLSLMGHGSEAVKCLLAVEPLTADAAILLATLLMDVHGNISLALSVCRLVCENEPTPAALWLCGVAAAAEGGHREALDCFRGAVALAPEDDKAKLCVAPI